MQIDANALALLVLPERDPEPARRVRAEFDAARGPLGTNWACLAEAFYYVGRRGTPDRVSALWALARDPDVLAIRHPTPAEEARAEAIMAKYADLPADLADALLVAAAEATDDLEIITIDRDFRVYRTADGRAFDARPQEAR